MNWSIGLHINQVGGGGGYWLQKSRFLIISIIEYLFENVQEIHEIQKKSSSWHAQMKKKLKIDNFDLDGIFFKFYNSKCKFFRFFTFVNRYYFFHWKC